MRLPVITIRLLGAADPEPPAPARQTAWLSHAVTALVVAVAVLLGRSPSPTPAPNPGPEPKPPIVDPVKPPPPPPAPPPAPVTHKLVVLTLYDSAAKMTDDQLITLSSKAVRSYLKDHCLTDAAGLPTWRYYDKTTSVADAPEWQQAMSRGLADPTPCPKMLVFLPDNKVEVYPVSTEAQAMADLRRWGGN